ncbi:MAG: glutamate mutase L [Actinomycetota bacterium]|nr:glutamate mutase L [Actinomycetota bacterium]
MTLPCVCLDVGSGWVKALGIDAHGEPVGAAIHRSTPEDLLVGVRAAAAAAGTDEMIPIGGHWRDTELLACSSAGGGLRLAVVGRERLAATEAGYRVASSAGARVVHIEAGELEPAGVRAMRASRPDVVLLLGGSGRGGDPERVLLANASRLARARFRAPIVLAAAADVRGDAAALLSATGRTVVTVDAVLPEPGVIVSEPARAAVTRLLPKHLVGGRGSAATARFRRLAQHPTPFAVRAALTELVRLRGVHAGAVLVIDVGCSTTDVYSALPPTVAGGDPAGGRTCVEADLGLRLTAPGILTEGQAQAVVDPLEADLLLPTVRRLVEETGFLPEDPGAQAEDRRLAALAAVLAARRHLRVAGRPLFDAGLGLVVLTGGVFRQPDSAGLAAVRDTLRGDDVLRERLAGCPIAVDDGFALAPAGLLMAAGHTEAARLVLDTAIAPDG